MRMYAQDIDWNAKVKEALDRTEFMSISTVDTDNECWTNPVQFGYDRNANVYFISMLNSKHVRNIQANGKISGAIYKTERFLGDAGDVLGLQFTGRARLLDTHDEVANAVSHYYGRDPRKLDPSRQIDNHLGKHAVWHFFKVELTELWCFDSRFFEEKRVQVPLHDLNIRLDD